MPSLAIISAKIGVSGDVSLTIGIGIAKALPLSTIKILIRIAKIFKLILVFISIVSSFLCIFKVYILFINIHTVTFFYGEFFI